MSSPASEDLAKLFLRLGVGILLLLHGLHKLSYGVSGIEQLLVNKGLPHYLAWGVFVGEIIAPLLMITGLYTRLAGWLSTVSMVFALWLAHSHQFLSLNSSGGWRIELQALFLIGSLCIALQGAGRHSLGGSGGRWN